MLQKQSPGFLDDGAFGCELLRGWEAAERQQLACWRCRAKRMYGRSPLGSGWHVPDSLVLCSVRNGSRLLAGDSSARSLKLCRKSGISAAASPAPFWLLANFSSNCRCSRSGTIRRWGCNEPNTMGLSWAKGLQESAMFASLSLWLMLMPSQAILLPMCSQLSSMW